MLQPGGLLWTQQVGAGNDAGLNAALGPYRRRWSRLGGGGFRPAQAAGLDVLRADEASAATRFLDVGAVVLQLRAVGWQVPDFDVERHRPQLLEIDRIIRTNGSFTVTDHRLLFQAVRTA